MSKQVLNYSNETLDKFDKIFFWRKEYDTI